MRRLLFATFLVSAAAIGFEILLMRVLSIVQWYHFAWMIISIALLGYGASGTLVALLRPVLEKRFEQAFAVSAMLFSVTLVLSYVLGQRIPFNALAIVWEPGQLIWLGLMYLVYFVPFLFAAACIGMAFACRHHATGRIYFADLLGAGVGAILIISLLFVLPINRALVVLAVAPLAASMLLGTRLMLLAQLGWLLLLTAAMQSACLTLQISPYKGLAQALAVLDSEVLSESSGPLGLLTVVNSPSVPFRHAPGLSINARDVPPEQLGVFTDADGLTAINRFGGDVAELDYLADMAAALPYALLEQPEVLVLGGGAGSDALLALYHRARRVDVVELNPQMTQLVTDTHADFAGRLYDDPRVVLHAKEARGFVARSRREHDLIHIGLLDSFGASGAGVHALNESYIYTVEALREYLSHTRAGGFVAITRWIKLPPRDSLKLFATAVAALRESGVTEPGDRLVLVRSWNTSLLLIKNGAITNSEIASIRNFCATRFLDVAYRPGISREETNRYNRLDEPYLYDGAIALLGDEAAEYLDRYKFHVAPATDDKPYYFHFFRWGSLREVLTLRDRGGAALIEWGYLVLITTLAQALLAGAILVLFPLLCIRRAAATIRGFRFGTYFVLLGLAFLLVEIAFIQKFILFLSHPLYSVAVVLSSFLIFAGFGSALSTSVVERRLQHPIGISVAIIAALALSYLVLLPMVFERFMGSADAVRVVLSVAAIAPLAFCMGMPFPLGLSRLSKLAPDFVPWAWGLNGFASVVSAVLAAVLAIELGFSAVILVALVCYVLAALLAGSADES